MQKIKINEDDEIQNNNNNNNNNKEKEEKESKITNNEFSLIELFLNLPSDILNNHIISFISRDWLFIS